MCIRDRDLSEIIQFDLDVELLKRTPSAFLGSCRYKLPEVQAGDQIFERIFSILDNLEIECFIYIGGNDSMDTIVKLSDYAALMGYKQKFIGVPKTIDNDLLITDHTPGYASAAKYIGATIKEIIRDCLSLSYDRKNVTAVSYTHLLIPTVHVKKMWYILMTPQEIPYIYSGENIVWQWEEKR